MLGPVIEDLPEFVVSALEPHPAIGGYEWHGLGGVVADVELAGAVVLHLPQLMSVPRKYTKLSEAINGDEEVVLLAIWF